MMCRTDWGVKVALFFCLPLAAISLVPSAIFAAPNKTPDEDIPEEVLRAEIYTDARSPIDGKLLTATEYVELMEKLRSLDSIPPEDLVSPKVREVVELLRLRKLLRQFIPFIP
ncbi:MAG: hypothetical protein ACOYN8_04500 [Pseudanabaena sp.]|jgi:hypothetical protein